MRVDSEASRHVFVSLGDRVGGVGGAVIRVAQCTEHEQVFGELALKCLHLTRDSFAVLAQQAQGYRVERDPPSLVGLGVLFLAVDPVPP
jgi:hypothetical protein